MSNRVKDAPELPDSIDITFPEPININGNDTTEFSLSRQPDGNDLGRYTFPDLLDGNVRALMHVTPKIIHPYLAPKIIKGLTARNNMALIMAYNAFFEGVDMEGMARPGNGMKVVTATTTKPPSGSTSSGQKAD